MPEKTAPQKNLLPESRNAQKAQFLQTNALFPVFPEEQRKKRYWRSKKSLASTMPIGLWQKNITPRDTPADALWLVGDTHGLPLRLLFSWHDVL